MDLCCTKGVFAEPGWSSYGQNEYLIWRQIVHWVTTCWSVISTESLPRLVFKELSSVTKPRGCNDTGKVLFLDAERQTTRQRSRTTALAPTELHRRMVHILPICIPSRQLYEKLSRGSVAISNKKKLSQFLLKKLVWFCEWAITIMSGCSWNFSSQPFCEMHSVVTVKTVVNFNDANIFCTTRNKIRGRQFVMRSRTIYQKNRRCHWNKKVKDDSNARECDEKVFKKKTWCSWINHPNQQTRKKLERKGIEREQCLWMWWLEYFIWKTKHNACEATMRINKQQMKEVRKKKKKKSWKVTLLVNAMINFFERQNMTLLITSSRSLMDPLHNSLTK